MYPLEIERITVGTARLISPPPPFVNVLACTVILLKDI